MFRSCFISRTVREKGHVFFRNTLTSVQAKASQTTPLLRERPYPIAEITKRMVRIRVKYEESQDDKERSLLRGEYKYYSGKAVHLRDAATTDIVAMVSVAAYFQFWDTALIDRCMEQLAGRMEDLSTIELSQLAQDLPLIQRSRSPEMRSVFKLLCANNSVRLREELSFEDHLDLIQNAVGLHCPLTFVQTLLECVEPYLIMEDGRDQQEQHDIDNETGGSASSMLTQLKSDALCSILQTILIGETLLNNIHSTSTSNTQLVNKRRLQFNTLTTPMIRRIKNQIFENAREQMRDANSVDALLSSVSSSANNANINHHRDESAAAENPNNTSSTTTPSSTASTNALVDLVERQDGPDSNPRFVDPKTMVKVFQILCALSSSSSNDNNNIISSSSSSSSPERNFMDEFTARQILEYFWSSSMVRKLSCAELLNLCLLYIQNFGINNEFFEEQFLIPVAQHHLIDTVPFLDAVELVNAFELIAMFALEATNNNNRNENRTRKNILLADHNNDRNALSSAAAGTSTGGAVVTPALLITSTFYDLVLEHLIMLRETAATIWPTQSVVLPQLKSLAVLVACMKNEEAALKKQQQQHQKHKQHAVADDDNDNDGSSLTHNNNNDKNFIQLHRPKLHAVVKSLCANIITASKDSMSASDCATFLALCASLEDYALDSSVSAVVRRLVSENTKSNNKKQQQQGSINVDIEEEEEQEEEASSHSLLEDLTTQQIQDLLLVWKVQEEHGGAETSNRRRIQPSVSNILIPALKDALQRKMVMDLS